MIRVSDTPLNQHKMSSDEDDDADAFTDLTKQKKTTTTTTTTASLSPEASVEKKSPVGSSDRTPSRRYLFMFFSFSSGPIAHRLCAVEVPNLPISAVEFPDFNLLVAKDLLAFPSQLFPSDMCCTLLGSKLYFLGGDRVSSSESDEFTTVYDNPNDVYYLNTSIVHESDPSLDMLKEATSMVTGKRHCYALAAYGKIYAIAGSVCLCLKSTTEDIARFEVFDPVCNVWEALADPPDLGNVFGHAVVRDKVYLSVMSDRVAYFDVKTHHWGFVGSSPISNFHGVAHFVNDDTLYACCFGSLASFYIKGVNGNAAPYFDLRGMLAPKADSPDSEPEIAEPDNLIHLGGQAFCYVQSRCLSDLDVDLLDNERKDLTIKLVVLQLLSPSSVDERNFNLPAEYFHVCEIAVPIDQSNDPEMIFSEAVYVPSEEEVVKEEKVDVEEVMKEEKWK